MLIEVKVVITFPCRGRGRFEIWWCATGWPGCSKIPRAVASELYMSLYVPHPLIKQLSIIHSSIISAWEPICSFTQKTSLFMCLFNICSIVLLV